jgi:hypothetical protein
MASAAAKKCLDRRNAGRELQQLVVHEWKQVGCGLWIDVVCGFEETGGRVTSDATRLVPPGYWRWHVRFDERRWKRGMTRRMTHRQTKGPVGPTAAFFNM